MTQALLQQLWGHVHFDQSSGVAVPKVMNPNLLDLGKLYGYLADLNEQAEDMFLSW